MYSSRSQAATELMIILAVVMIIFLLIVVVVNKTSHSVDSQTIALQAKEFVQDISHNARLVYNQGTGAKTQVIVTLPGNVQNVTFSNTTISLIYSFGGSSTIVEENLGFLVNGSIPNLVAGNFKLNIEAKNGYVQISNA